MSELISRYSPPAGRVCVTGMSGGARMSCVLAAARADLVSAVGAVAGLRAGSRHAPTRPVPILAFHGTADRINPLPRRKHATLGRERRGERPRLGGGQPYARAARSGRSQPHADPHTYGAEGKPGEVTLFTSKGAGHTWPGGRMGLFLRLFLGRTSTEIDATSRIWDFDRAHTGEA